MTKTKNKILSKTFRFHKRQIVGGGGKGAGRGAQKGAKGLGWHGVPPNAPPGHSYEPAYAYNVPSCKKCHLIISITLNSGTFQLTTKIYCFFVYTDCFL